MAGDHKDFLQCCPVTGALHWHTGQQLMARESANTRLHSCPKEALFCMIFLPVWGTRCSKCCSVCQNKAVKGSTWLAVDGLVRHFSCATTLKNSYSKSGHLLCDFPTQFRHMPWQTLTQRVPTHNSKRTPA